jgi:hypothetical protein
LRDVKMRSAFNLSQLNGSAFHALGSMGKGYQPEMAVERSARDRAVWLRWLLAWTRATDVAFARAADPAG